MDELIDRPAVDGGEDQRVVGSAARTLPCLHQGFLKDIFCILPAARLLPGEEEKAPRVLCEPFVPVLFRVAGCHGGDDVSLLTAPHAAGFITGR